MVCAYSNGSMTKTGAFSRFIDRAQHSALRVSVVVPAYNEAANIIPCLQALANQIVPLHEAIVVDNRSTDHTADLVQAFQAAHPNFPLILLAQHDVQGLIPTRNYGFAHVSGDVIGRIDADSRVQPYWVAAVKHAFEDPTISGVTGPVSYYDMPFEKLTGRVDHLARRTFLALGKEYHFLFGSNMAITAHAWEAIAELASRDEEDLLHEDIDLALTLQRHGLRVSYEKYMRAAISSRRIDTPRKEFMHYVGRFGRTYEAHGVNHWHLHAPPTALKVSYWPLRGIHRTNRAFHNFRARRKRL